MAFFSLFEFLRINNERKKKEELPDFASLATRLLVYSFVKKSIYNGLVLCYCYCYYYYFFFD